MTCSLPGRYLSDTYPNVKEPKRRVHGVVPTSGGMRSSAATLMPVPVADGNVDEGSSTQRETRLPIA